MENTSEKSHVEITNRNSSFFGHTFEILEKSEQFVIALVKVGETEIKHLFHISDVTEVQK